MTDLKAMCEEASFKSVRTYIASGNVVFQSTKTEAQVKTVIEAALAKYSSKPVAVFIRTAAEIAAVHSRNPFPQMPGNRTVAFFLDKPPAADAHKTVSNRKNEQLELGFRELYVYYPDGIGQSRLNIPAAKNGTARNMNTIAKLAEMATEL